ncbi:MAG: homocysteine S-methyltransferase family protein [Clostridium sp.]
MRDYIIMDGAMGTYVRKFINDIKRTDLLTLTNKDIIKKIHMEYINSGAEIITTNTFITNYLWEEDEQLSKQIINEAIEIAREAINQCNRNTLIALDITTGNHYYEIAKIAEEKGVDFIIVETITMLKEMKKAIIEIRRVFTGKVICSFSFNDSNVLKDGNTVMDICEVIKDVDYIGVNCGKGLEQCLVIGNEFNKYSDIPLFIKPNLGIPNSIGEYEYTLNEFKLFTDKYKKLGVKILGGCCGTTPEFIKILK